MIDVASLQPWLERETESTDTVSEVLTARLESILGRAPAARTAGSPLPPEWYVQLFGPLAPQSSLTADGHPPKGDVLPPVPLPRRMFAGRRVEFRGDLRIGDVVTRKSRVMSITPKDGKSGESCFVTLRHELSTPRGLAIVEEQDVVYKAAAAAAPTTEVANGSATIQVQVPRIFTETLTPDPTLLFRYSALTFNAHRIHYDLPYARDVEGYEDLVVNGGLSTLLLWNCVQRQHGRPLRRSATRNLKPLFVNRPMTIAMSALSPDGTVTAWIEDSSGVPALQAALELS